LSNTVKRASHTGLASFAMTTSVTLIGVGSSIRADDAIGTLLVAALADEPGVTALQWGDRDALDIAAGLLELSGPVVLVDAARMGAEPGKHRVFRPDHVTLRGGLGGVSTHGFGLADGLAVALDLGLDLPLALFGVEPASIALEEGLSPALQDRLPVLVDALRQTVRDVAWVAVELSLRGVVQGVGLRPALQRAALAAGLGGWVQNCSGSVRLRVEGARAEVMAWLERLPDWLPTQARLDAVEAGEERLIGAIAPFQVLPSVVGEGAEVVLPPDTRTCAACALEVFTPGERRYGYAFTTCVDCGPRYTVVTGQPYDRERTTLARFPLCAACAAEYADPSDRRAHAESLACPACGPRLRAVGPEGVDLDGDPLRRARAVLAGGGVVAVRGLGGFQLVVDATQAAAVERLRSSKRRFGKAFALMVMDEGVAGELVELGDAGLALLTSAAAPIVLAPARPAAEALRARVAPEADHLGLMLPAAPLHHLLHRPLVGDPTPALPLLVVTSGNRRGEPLALTLEVALARLEADLFLDHDRPIARRCDDSVAVVRGGQPQVWRRARGYAPEPVRLARALQRSVLALGGDLKGALAVGRDEAVVLSPHLGDLDDPEALDAAEQVARELPDSLGLRPDCVAVDRHPDLRSSRLGAALAERLGVPLAPVQHHHAHAAACMAEHGLDDALALVYDGVGLGADGALWGGELLRVSPGGFERLGTFASAPLPGGDAATLAPLRQLVGRCAIAGLPLPAGDPVALRAWSHQALSGLNAPNTHAVGRLFDAVAAALGLAPERVRWEGQAAMRLEVAARSWRGAVPALPMPLAEEGGLVVVTWEPLLRALLASDQPAAALARGFHHALIDASVALAQAGLERTGPLPIVLSGGVFQNGLLAEGVMTALTRRGYAVRQHQRVPPGDGGLALGQVVIAGAYR